MKKNEREQDYVAVGGECAWCYRETDDMERDGWAWHSLNGERIPICSKCSRYRLVFVVIEPATKEALEQAALKGGFGALPEEWYEVAAAGAAPYLDATYGSDENPGLVALPKESLMAVDMMLFTVINGEPMVVGPHRAFMTEAGILYTHFENFC